MNIEFLFGFRKRYLKIFIKNCMFDGVCNLDCVSLLSDLVKKVVL